MLGHLFKQSSISSYSFHHHFSATQAEENEGVQLLQAYHQPWPPPQMVYGGLYLEVPLFFFFLHGQGDWRRLWWVINLTFASQCLNNKFSKLAKVIKELYPRVKWDLGYKLSIKLKNPLKMHQNDPKIICTTGTYQTLQCLNCCWSSIN